MPTYRTASNTYCIQHTGGYGTGHIQNVAGAIGNYGHFKKPPIRRGFKGKPIIAHVMGPISALNPDLIVPATIADTPIVVQLLEDFQVQVTGQLNQPVEAARIERRYSRWPQVQVIDARHGVYCELTVHEDTGRVEYTAAFPRGASKAFFGSIFGECARRVITEMASRQPGLNVFNWIVWGEFLHGQDAVQVPDGGRSICESWRDYYASFGLILTVRQPPGSTSWIAEMKLGDMASHYGP